MDYTTVIRLLTFVFKGLSIVMLKLFHLTEQLKNSEKNSEKSVKLFELSRGAKYLFKYLFRIMFFPI